MQPCWRWACWRLWMPNWDGTDPSRLLLDAPSRRRLLALLRADWAVCCSRDVGEHVGGCPLWRQSALFTDSSRLLPHVSFRRLFLCRWLLCAVWSLETRGVREGECDIPARRLAWVRDRFMEWFPPGPGFSCSWRLPDCFLALICFVSRRLHTSRFTSHWSSLNWTEAWAYIEHLSVLLIMCAGCIGALGQVPALMILLEHTSAPLAARCGFRCMHDIKKVSCIKH
jgi:hypothetical protein